MIPILQTNDLPIREIKICNGLCGKQGHVGYWCPNHDYYTKHSVILTPNTFIANAYALLRTTRLLLLDYSYSDTQFLRDKIKQIKQLIETFE